MRNKCSTNERDSSFLLEIIHIYQHQNGISLKYMINCNEQSGWRYKHALDFFVMDFFELFGSEKLLSLVTKYSNVTLTLKV